ncbi:MAG TPA: DUF1707 domain-containing protein [Streptosporangiaceae bacterium]|jgi:hypothetical protein
MATGYNIRVGDAEREATASQLREHYADGRITLDELNERLDQAFAAKTRTDLNAVMRDLPIAPMTPRPVVPLPGPRSSGSGSSGSGSRGFAFMAPMFALFWLCLVLGGVFLFGFGDKPIAVVLVLAALAFLRKLFGRRRRGRGGSGRRR